MITLTSLCRDIFLLAHADVDSHGPRRGQEWEQRIAEYLANRNVPVESHPGGYTVFGHVSLSALKHQIDASIGCSDAIVVAEWKAFKGRMLKNELLRFKAASDDYFMALGSNMPSRPVVRIFGGTGYASDEIRAYAYLHGIVLIETERWPTPTLVSNSVIQNIAKFTGPEVADRKHMAWTFRPVQKVLVAQRDGSFVFPKPPASAMIKSLNSIHEYWSDALWEEIDSEPGGFELMVEHARRRAMR
ncbi:MAG: hypothetical protein OXD31_16195 [Chloroflexi bacterium]|nr:hypothetical protein [Chloroflexota bacterium]